jgi:hypothetical protein
MECKGISDTHYETMDDLETKKIHTKSSLDIHHTLRSLSPSSFPLWSVVHSVQIRPAVPNRIEQNPGLTS